MLPFIIFIAAVATSTHAQYNYNGEGLQQYYGPSDVIKPVQEEKDDVEDLSRYYRAEPATSVAQANLQYPQQPLPAPSQGVQYFFQSPGFQQQQLEPQAYYQQQQLQPQVLYQQQSQAAPQQLRALSGFADPRFQQDYKYRMIYANQEMPTPRPQPAQQPQPQQPSPYSLQPQTFQPQPFQAPAQAQQFPTEFQQPAPFSAPIAQPAPAQLGVSYSSAGAVSKTSFSGNGVSYTYGGF